LRLSTGVRGAVFSELRPSPAVIGPICFAIALVVNRLAEIAAPMPALWRPLLVAAALVLALQALLGAAFRDRHAGAVLASAGILLVIEVPAGIALVGGTILLAVAVYALHHADVWRRVASALNLVGAIVLLLAIAGAINAGVVTWPSSPISPGASGAGPNIYVILLDGYPRSDTLATEFDYDNRPFLDAMQDLGLIESRSSRSNYAATTLTLASMFNRAHVRDLGLVSEDGRVDLQRAYRAIAQGQVLDDLRRHGYEVVAISGPIAGQAIWSADRVLDSGHLSDLELSLLRSGRLRQILPDLQRAFVGDQHRSRIRWSLATVASIALEPAARPRFVFAHILAPHVPQVLGPHGEDRDLWPCFPVCSLYGGGIEYGRQVHDARLRDHITGLNGLVADTVRQIIRSSTTPPVIVLMSDHGVRHDYDDTAEMFRSLLLAYTPGRQGVIPQDSTPINLIPRLLNAYVGADLPLASEESYASDMPLADQGILTVAASPEPDTDMGQ
jgi:hypothetical protein